MRQEDKEAKDRTFMNPCIQGTRERRIMEAPNSQSGSSRDRRVGCEDIHVREDSKEEDVSMSDTPESSGRRRTEKQPFPT